MKKSDLKPEDKIIGVSYRDDRTNEFSRQVYFYKVTNVDVVEHEIVLVNPNITTEDGFGLKFCKSSYVSCLANKH